MENEIRYTINKDICIEIPKEMKSMTFQGFFTFLRKSLQIKYTRRIHIDSILKKCKGKFFKAVNDCLKKCLKIYIKKLPQTFITNISIDYNKNFLDFTIRDLYTFFSLTAYSMEVIIQKKYYRQGKEEFFKYIYLSNIKDLYYMYLESKRYKKELELMKKKKGIKVAYLHQFVAENFINYYTYSKPHVKRKNLEINNDKIINNIIHFNNNVINFNNNNNILNNNTIGNNVEIGKNNFNFIGNNYNEIIGKNIQINNNNIQKSEEIMINNN